MSSPVLPPIGADWKVWGRQLTTYLRRQLPRLQVKTSGETPTEDGIILWDRTGYPVVSKNNEFRQLVIADGYAQFGQDNDITAALADTAYAITFDAPGMSDGISQGSPASRIVFEEAGTFLLCFTAQITSTSASNVDFYFWPKINGTDVTGSTIKASLHSNGDTKVVSRSALFQVSANDYIESYWAVSSTSGSLKAFAATAFSPATPSVTLAITRIRQ